MIHFEKHIQEAEDLGKVIPPRLRAFLLSLESEKYSHNGFDWEFYGFQENETKVLVNTGDRDLAGFSGVEIAESGIGEFLFLVEEKDIPNQYEDKIYHFLYDSTAVVTGILYPEIENKWMLTSRFFGVDEDDNWIECDTREELESKVQ
ncbi:MAG: hypothetical protein AAFV95_17960 [Bacteroidota bacterium]